jgi:hypothetical protein
VKSVSAIGENVELMDCANTREGENATVAQTNNSAAKSDAVYVEIIEDRYDASSWSDLLGNKMIDMSVKMDLQKLLDTDYDFPRNDVNQNWSVD